MGNGHSTDKSTYKSTGELNNKPANESTGRDKVDALIAKQASIAEKNNHIEPALYGKHNVKIGLRNSDGTGVLVGLTRIGDVFAYVMKNNTKIPMEGKLICRGIDISEMVQGFQKEKRFGFEECSYLLLFGELPNKRELEEFEQMLAENRELPEGFARDLILKAPSRNIMNKLARCVLAAYSYDENPDDTSIPNVIRQSIKLIAQFPTIAAYGYQALAHYYKGQSLYTHKPQPHLSTAENILHMIRPDCKYTRIEAEVLDLALVLHAEHGGGNNSTFTIHVVSSTGTDTYSAIAAGLGSLKGPKHGGANIKVMMMMDDVKENVKDWEDEEEIEKYLEKIIRKEAFDKSGLIYGMGHAVYTLSDPRAVMLKKKAGELAREKGFYNEFQLFERVEKLSPKVFCKVKNINKPMCANVDFYSGFVYKMLNIPVELYTPIFAIARISGWCAHRIEELVDGSKIIRPAYMNVEVPRGYVPMNERE
ncbi:MAG: citrate/2-methylcitrate synthase [Clostridiaceae bacterium]|nr:citrate/2-methylcitrate synthase [Clostridiaceae bacterium]